MELELELRLIKDTNNLEGTCYFEFLLGKYKNKCWNQGAVFLSEEAYDLIEVCFLDNIEDYDHYSFMEADQEVITKITQCLSRLEGQIEKSVSVEQLSESMKIYEYQRSELESDWPDSKERLKTMISELSQWFQEAIIEHKVVSILGM